MITQNEILKKVIDNLNNRNKEIAQLNKAKHDNLIIEDYLIRLNIEVIK